MSLPSIGMAAGANNSFVIVSPYNGKYQSIVETPVETNQYADVVGEIGQTQPTWGSIAALTTEGKVYLTKGMDNDGSLAKLLTQKTFISISYGALPKVPAAPAGNNTVPTLLAVDDSNAIHMYQAGKASCSNGHCLNSNWTDTTSSIQMTADTRWKSVSVAPSTGRNNNYDNMFWGIDVDGNAYQFFSTAFNGNNPTSYIKRQMFAGQKFRAISVGFDSKESCPSASQGDPTAYLAAIGTDGKFYVTVDSVLNSGGLRFLTGSRLTERTYTELPKNGSLVNIKYQPSSDCGLQLITQDSAGRLYSLPADSLGDTHVRATLDRTYAAFTVGIQNGTQNTVAMTAVPGQPQSVNPKPSDTTPPVISGATDKTINIGDQFDPRADVTATDDVDGDLTAKIQITGSVDNTTPGAYKLTYAVEDNAGNKATANRTITVTQGGTTIACAPQTGVDPAASAWQTATFLLAGVAFWLAFAALRMQGRLRRRV